MNDKDNSGKVSVEEVMQILFLRYGRQLLDSVRARRRCHRRRRRVHAAADASAHGWVASRSNWRRFSARATQTAAHATCR